MPSTDIVLFDIPSTIASPISPHGWKVRMILNYKGLNFTTRFVPGTQLEATFKPLGIPPTGTKPNGAPHYTVPAIIDRTDSSNPVALSDSNPIIDYLEKTYPPPPTQPAVFPPGTRALQVVFNQTVVTELIYFVPTVAARAHLASKVEADREDFRGRMERVFGKPFGEIEKTGEEREAAWVEMERVFKVLGDAIDGNGVGEYLTGERLAGADFALAGCMVFIKLLSPDDAFARLRGWHGGRWARYFDAFKPWMALENPQ